MLKFQGSHTDFGHFIGQRLQDYHHNFFNWTNAETLCRQLKIYQKFYPELITETRATAEYLHRDPEVAQFLPCVKIIKFL